MLASEEKEVPSVYAKVADWILKFPAEERSDYAGLLIAKWESDDSARAMEWVGNVTPEKRRDSDRGIRRIVQRSQDQRTFALTDEPLRRQILTTFTMLLGKTPAEREESVDQIGLAPEDAKILTGLARESR